MRLTYADTNKIHSIGSDIIELSNKFNVEITELFKKLSSFPYDSQAWTGTPAETYASHVLLDKKQYTDFATELRTYGNKIINTAENIEECIKTTMSGGEYKG